MSLLYLDTNIYLDYLESRDDYMRPLNEFSFQLFRRTFSCEFTLVVSGLLLTELYKHNSGKEVQELMKELRKYKKVITTNISYHDRQRARELSFQRHTPFYDTLHAVIAERMHVAFLVTRNIHDFLEIQDIVPIILPENL